MTDTNAHAFVAPPVAPAEPPRDVATVRRCTRKTPTHWHVDMGEFDVEFATEAEANAEAARLNKPRCLLCGDMGWRIEVTDTATTFTRCGCNPAGPSITITEGQLLAMIPPHAAAPLQETTTPAQSASLSPEREEEIREFTADVYLDSALRSVKVDAMLRDLLSEVDSLRSQLADEQRHGTEAIDRAQTAERKAATLATQARTLDALREAATAVSNEWESPTSLRKLLNAMNALSTTLAETKNG